MHPFGGTQICPRCSKAVYAAEQVMGPGRKLFHKPCLSCMNCKRRLDSYSLLEHDEMPYCKPCHLKLFGTRDLRSANHPYRPHTPDNSTSPPRVASPMRSMTNDNAFPKLKANRSLSPTSTSFPTNSFGSLPKDEPEQSGSEAPSEAPETIPEEGAEKVDENSPSPNGTQPPPITTGFSNTGRPGLGISSRTGPLSPTRTNGTSFPSPITRPGHKSNTSLPVNGTNGILNGNGNGGPEVPAAKPLTQTATGTRYGNALNGGVGVQLTGTAGSPRRWVASSNPTCPRCNKSVYFAEQVKAVGKTFHKGCLRCVECSTLLDSSRLRDHDGDPICMRCYGKVHGPQGSGYALLGKTGA